MLKHKAKAGAGKAQHKPGGSSPPKIRRTSSKKASATQGPPAPAVALPHTTPGPNGQGRAGAPAGGILPAVPTIDTFKSQSGVDLTEKIKELVRLAQEQGYLT